MSVKNYRSPLLEPMVYVTPDGVRYPLHNPPKRTVLGAEGWGMLPISVETTSGPYQHGVDALSYRGTPRTITITIRFNECGRRELRDRQRELLNILRPSRTNLNNPTPGTLIWYLANGAIFAASVQATDGPGFPNRSGGWDEFAIQDTIEFTAFNPVLFDPTLKTGTVSDFSPIITANTELSFPISFPISFGVPPQIRVLKNLPINYLGDWLEYPTMLLTGPAALPKITNAATGIYIELNYTLVAGEIVTYDLSYGQKTITSSINGDLGGYVVAGSETAQFALQPDPIVAGGVNTIQVRVDHGTIATQLVVQYYNRFTGV
jgi:hypothetical protein